MSRVSGRPASQPNRLANKLTSHGPTQRPSAEKHRASINCGHPLQRCAIAALDNAIVNATVVAYAGALARVNDAPEQRLSRHALKSWVTKAPMTVDVDGAAKGVAVKVYVLASYVRL